ncbi:hypothetical protein HMPREF2621_12945 [Lactobacillus sp. HMSC072E07]|nr:hypothetical protein HMPREF2621_12945 [Lactobacillus sp. HMSC072E07]
MQNKDGKKVCKMLTSKMHALNGLVSVVVSANMAYLACTIKNLYYTCKTSKLSLMFRAFIRWPPNLAH